MFLKDWLDQSLKIWSLLKDMIVGKPEAPANADLSTPADVVTKAKASLIDEPITNLFDNPRPANTTPAKDLVTKCLAVLHWVDDHSDIPTAVSKGKAEYFHNHLVALKRDCEVRKDGLDEEDKMLADSVISLLKGIYTTKDDWFPAPAPIPVSATSPGAIEVATWAEIVGDAKSTKVGDFPFEEQADPAPAPKAESPAVKVKEKPAKKKGTKKPRKGKETAEEKQARVLAEISDAVQDAHSWLYNVEDLLLTGKNTFAAAVDQDWFAREIKAAIAEAEQLILKLGSLAAEAVALGADWTHAILAEAEQTFDEIVAAIKTLGTNLPEVKKKKPPKKKRTDYPVKKKTKK